VPSVREECLDHLLILNQTNLWLVLNTFVDYYNTARPHQGLAQQSPIPRRLTCDGGSIQRRDVVDGIICDYYRAPNDTALVLG
jgi:putative transposase